MMASLLKTIFFGSSAYCLPILEALQQQTNLVGIITREDKPIGRKKILTSSPPKQFGQKASISVFTPRDKKELSNMKDILMELQADVAVVADYGLIIPQEIFTLPRLQTVNVHFSKLPDLRGASPVQFTILRGDTTAWITIQRMAITLDTGDILWQQDYPLSGTETTGDLYTKLFNIAGENLPNTLNTFALGLVSPTPQNDTEATFTRKLSREDGFIPFDMLQIAMEGKQPTAERLDNWTLYAETLKFFSAGTGLQPDCAGRPVPKRFGPPMNIGAPAITPALLLILVDRVLRAFTPWPGIWTVLPNGKRLKVLTIEMKENTLHLQSVQMEGKGPTDWKDIA